MKDRLVKSDANPFTALFTSKKFTMAFFWAVFCGTLAVLWARSSLQASVGALWAGTAAAASYVLGQALVEGLAAHGRKTRGE